MNLKKYRDLLENNKENDIHRIQEFLRQPCIPSNFEGCKESAELLIRYYQELGCEEIELIKEQSKDIISITTENLKEDIEIERDI